MVKAFSYVRFSSGRQAEGDSERRQIAAAERYAADHGYELDTQFKDLAMSDGAVYRLDLTDPRERFEKLKGNIEMSGGFCDGALAEEFRESLQRAA